MIGRGRDGIARLALCAALSAGAPGAVAQDAPDLAVTQPDEMGELGEGTVVADPWDRSRQLRYPRPAQDGLDTASLPDGPAEARSGILTLDDVLRSSARTAPQIIETLAGIRQAEGRALSAQGAFDIVFDAEGRGRALGYYDGTYLTGEAKRPLRDNGGYLYGKYRVARGDFPIYEDQYFTNQLGEVKVGGLYSLLRDRLIDERRAKLSIASQDIDIARFESQATAIGVQVRAMRAYQQWLAAGLRLNVYRDLLALAEQRRGGISRQIELGARASILLTENDQNLVRRRARVIDAEQAFVSAANDLSLFYRDADGRPVRPTAAQLPASGAALAGPGAVVESFALRDRPEIRTLLARVDQGLARLALAENDLSPRLDAFGEVGKDFGAEALGGPSRTPLELIVGFRFSMPLENRAARGRIRTAQGELDALEWRQQYQRDQIVNEIENLAIEIETTRRLVEITEQELALAQKLAAAERRRFQLGAADFFIVNQREELVADIAVRLVDTQLRYAAAKAAYAAAVVDREALGLVR
ncbi:TolC family protein [uncultured Croceicoccus sp.]|uniref:TolC family protein n=1 Tax=uncultured Croceicoccus sp. TaxID=1295329 RepID=UPI002626F0E0|nr:TolC family protein [uncultured Croceicoccus sp.]